MAVALGREAAWDQAVIVDFGNTHTSPWRFSLYDDMSDEDAFVLYQASVAPRNGPAKSSESSPIPGLKW